MRVSLQTSGMTMVQTLTNRTLGILGQPNTQTRLGMSLIELHRINFRPSLIKLRYLLNIFGCSFPFWTLGFTLFPLSLTIWRAFGRTVTLSAIFGMRSGPLTI